MNIGLIGLGGGGSNSVVTIYKQFKAQNGFGMDFAVVNTDIQALKKIDTDLDRDKNLKKIIIGQNLLAGLGAGAEPEKGFLATVESQEKIRDFMRGKELVFVSVGFGGGTGSGAAPVVTKIAREEGVVPVVFGTFPWDFEGESRKINAYHSLNSVLNQKGTGSVIIVNNNIGFEGTVKELFEKCDNFLRNSILSILNLLYDKDATINIDFNDIKTALKINSTGMFFFEKQEGFKKVGEEEADEHNERLAAELSYKIVSNPTAVSLDRPGNLVINISGAEDILTMKVVEAIMFSFNEKLRNFRQDKEIKTIFGVTLNPLLGNKISTSGFLTNVSYTEIEAKNPGVSLEQAYPNLIKIFGTTSEIIIED